MNYRFVRTLVLSAGCAIVIASCSSKAEQAAEYNDAIVSRQLRIISALNVLDSALSASAINPAQLEYARVNLDARIKEGLLSLDSIGPFRKDPLLETAAKELFNSYGQMADKDYAQLIQIRLLPDSLMTGALADSNNAVIDRIRQVSKESQEKFLLAQQEFGKKYNLSFE